MQKSIIIASKNPVKNQATLGGFQRMFPKISFTVNSVSVPSMVSSQPRSEIETQTGAANRAKLARLEMLEADYWVGIEGGVEDTGQEISAFAWVVILDKSQMGKGRTGTFFLPERVAKLLRAGKELGEADDIVFQRVNSKLENGAVGLLTGNVIERADLYEQAVVLALIPFKNPDFFPCFQELNNSSNEKF